MAEIDVRALRDRLGMDRGQFEAAYGVPARTLQDWEQGRRKPIGAALAYLGVIAADPEGIKATRAKGMGISTIPSRPAAAPRVTLENNQRNSKPPAPARVMIRAPRTEQAKPAVAAPYASPMSVEEILAQYRRDRGAG